ncbi:MAG: preprotein translocase subunit Sec61beta [Candidatus Pacearchaeota archaeon]
MGKENQIQMPGVFGGLIRYNEEYDSKFKFKPWHVIAFVIVLAFGVIALKLLFPITSSGLG